MQKALMVAFYFPPLGGGGTPRSVKFVKYLPEFGWKPVVLAPKTWNYGMIDETWYRELPRQMELHRTNTLEPHFVYRVMYRLGLGSWVKPLSDRLLLPDDRIGWLPFARKAGLELIAKGDIDLIYTTSAPYTSHLIGLALKRATGLPWVADFRDEWLEHPSHRYSLLQRRLVARWEREVLTHADRVVTTTEAIRSLLASKVPRADHIRVITNGYDDDQVLPPDSPQSPQLTFTYSGNFYGDYNPNRFLTALSELVAAGELPASDIRVNFVGAAPDAHLVREKGLADVVHHLGGYRPHGEVREIIRNSHALLLLKSGEVNIPGKAFEYVASGRPIFAVVPPEQEVAQLIQRTGTGIIADYYDMGAIKRELLGLYQAWKAGRLPYDPIESEIQAYSRRNLTARLVETFEQATHGR